MAQSYLQEHEDPIDITQLLYVDISVFKEIFFLLYWATVIVKSHGGKL